MTSIAVVGSRDGRLEEMLRAAGMQPSSVRASALPSFGHGTPLPDVIVLDVRADADIPRELSALKRQNPVLGVVIVAAALDPALLLEAMRAGVNELVADPVTQADLERAVARVLGQRPRTERRQLFGFVGAKGGVGTTTVAVNVATALGKADKSGRTLLIDIHQAGGDAAVFLGVEPRFSVLDAIENIHRLDESYLGGLVTEVAPRLDLLASSDRTFATAVDPSKIRAVLDFVTGVYRYTVLDLPRSDAAVLDALDQAEALFIVANQELATVKSGGRLATTLRQRYGREKVKIILSRSDRQADIGVSDVERAIGADIASSFPSDYRVALQALNKGRPLALDADSELAGMFHKFAERLAGAQHSERTPPVRAGLLGRFTQSRRA